LGLAAALAVGIGLSIAIRYCLLDFKSLDYYASLKPWYNTIKSEGFAAFASPFSTYNPPYLYLLYLIARFLPDLPMVVAVKLPALVSDFICAYLVFLIARLKFSNSAAAPIAAGMLVLFAPSVVLNSAFWGQADSLFTAGLLACTYFLMKQRPGWGILCFSVALAFKLQAIFLVPVLLAMGLRGAIPWKNFLIVPPVLFLALVPAWVAGRPIAQLFDVYLYQASQFEVITLNAPSAYAWLPGSKQVFNLFYFPGVIMGLAAAFLLSSLIYRSPGRLTGPVLLELALAAMLIMPYFLPKMHDRYFYPADILSIAFAFFVPELFYIPILVDGVSFLSYQPFLFERDLVPLPVLAAALLLAIGLLFRHSIAQIYGAGSAPGEKSLPASASNAEVGALDALGGRGT
jgi:Gpi18-like mannosyltransferase